MTEHSTEELRRQHEAAKSRASAASAAASEAKARYYDALKRDKMAEFAAMGGVVGVTRVRVADRWSRKIDMTRGPFVVTGATTSFGTAEYTLAKIKKDGTPSIAPSGADTKDIFILPKDQPHD